MKGRIVALLGLALSGLLWSACGSSHHEVVRERVIERPTTVVVERPAPIAENPGPPPGRDYAWVPGHWEQDPRGWLWVSGHWRHRE